MTQKEKKQLKNLVQQDPRRMRKIIKLQGDVKKLEKKYGEWEQFVNNAFNYCEREDKKLLRRIVWIEATLLKKADKPTKKVIKIEAKKQEKGFLALVKKMLSKKLKK